MKKSIYVVLAISIVLNGVLLYLLKNKGVFFNESHLWTDWSMETSGVLVFNDKKMQPNVSDFVQHYEIRCEEKSCTLVESTLSGSSIINFVRVPEVVSLNYLAKEAVIKYNDCLFTISKDSTTFNCPENKLGVLGSHISLFYNR